MSSATRRLFGCRSCLLQLVAQQNRQKLRTTYRASNVARLRRREPISATERDLQFIRRDRKAYRFAVTYLQAAALRRPEQAKACTLNSDSRILIQTSKTRQPEPSKLARRWAVVNLLTSPVVRDYPELLETGAADDDVSAAVFLMGKQS